MCDYFEIKKWLIKTEKGPTDQLSDFCLIKKALTVFFNNLKTHVCEGILRARINFFGRCFFNRIFSLIIYIVIKHQNLPVNVTIISDSSICIRRGFQPEWSLLASLSKLAIGLMAEFAPRNLAGSTLKALKFLFCQLYTNRENAQLRKSDLSEWFLNELTLFCLIFIKSEVQWLFLAVFLCRRRLLIHFFKLRQDRLLEHKLYLGQFCILLCWW